MKKQALRGISHAAAVGLFVVHLIVIAILLFGWVWDALWPIYISLLVIVLVENIFLGYCILSRWEFSLRRMWNPKIKYDSNFTTYYTYKLTRHQLPDNFMRVAGIFFCAASININLYFKFLS